MGLVDHFHFFGGVTILFFRTNLRNDIKCNRVRECFVGMLGISEMRLGALFEVACTGQSGSACRLVGANHHAFDPSSVMQRLHGEYHLGRRTIGTRNHSLVISDSLGIHFWNNQWNFRIHPPITTLVNNHTVSFGSPRNEFCSRIIRRTGNRQIDVFKNFGDEFFYRIFLASEIELFPCRPFRC